MPRLLLINPSAAGHGLGNVKATAWPPLSLPYLAAVTPAHWQVSLLDENVEPVTVREADLVGITAYTASVNRAYAISSAYRERGIPTVLGGIHVSMRPEEAEQFCDSVVIGEAENLWPTVVADFERSELKRRYQGGPVDLATLPLPRRELLDSSRYRFGSLQTSRGCPMRCSFCSVTAFNGQRFRRRPLELVLEEVAQIPQKLVLLADDNILGYGNQDREWARCFFEAVVRRRMGKIFYAQSTIALGEDPKLLRLAYRAGLRIVFVGLESVSQDTLRGFHKALNLKAASTGQMEELIKAIRTSGIAVVGGFVLGADGDDKGVFDETFRFVHDSGVDALQVTKPTPLPGTQLWEEMTRGGRLLKSNFPADWDEYRFTKMVFEPAQLSVEEIYRGFTYLRMKYYGRAETVRRSLRTLAATKSPTAAALAFLFDRSYRNAFFQSEHYARYRDCDLGKPFAAQS